MKHLLRAVVCFIFLAIQQNSVAEKVDWYLYIWSTTTETGGDVGQFEATDESDVFLLSSCSVTEQGVKFGVHKSDWSVQYGWSDNGGSVSTTGAAVELSVSDGATGWLALPIGEYDVTFNLSNATIRFDKSDSGSGEGGGDESDGDYRQFLRGGDLSMATYIEDWGAKFYDRDGQEGDVFDILQEYGVNFVRLRLYNEPGTAIKDGSTTYRTPIMTSKYPSGYPYAGEDDILSLAKRAKDHNMQICLTFNMTDYWSNATMQMIPAAWGSAGSTEALGDSVYNFVYRYMERMSAQGTIPEYVSVGNETNGGMLFQDTNGNSVSYGGKTTNIENAVYLYNKAYDAIKAVSPSTQVIWHHSYGHDGKIGTCRSFFKNMEDAGGKYDIVGGSYYPTWAAQQNSTDNTPTGMLKWAADMKNNLGKPVMIMEVGYSWTRYRPYGRNGGDYEGQLGLNGSYNEASEAGQKAFMQALHKAIDQDDNIIGYLYWDPIFVDQQVNGSWIKSCWAEKYSGSGTTWWEDGNVISNTTWFDYNGKALPVLDAIKALKEDDTSTSLESVYDSEQESSAVRKYLKGQQLIIEVGNKRYDSMGHRL